MKQRSYLQFLSLDLRSLALFRVLLGWILIYDLILRLPVLNAFYTDTGVLPRSVLLSEFNNPNYFSLFLMSGQYSQVLLLCALGLFFYLALLLGYRTRLFTVLSWIFFVSFTARNPVVSHGGDDLIRMALFWMMFLPSNAFYSVDKSLGKDHTIPSPSLLNFASFAFLLQLIVMYFTTALLKWHPIWVSEGSALHYALQLDQFLTWFGRGLRLLPLETLKLSTFVILWVELLVPLLVFIPWKNSTLRQIVILTLIIFHLGIFMTFKLGTFPWICMAYWLAFLPSEFWSFCEAKWHGLQKTTTVFYDGECGYCLKMLKLIQTFLILPGIQIRKAQETESIWQLMQKENSWLVQSNSQEIQSHYRAFLALLSVSPFRLFKPLFSLRLVNHWGTAAYRWQADRRPLMASVLGVFRSRRVNTQSHPLSQLLALSALLFVLYWNWAVHSPDDKWIISKPIFQVGSALRLHQQWNMFAPYPWMEDGWMVTEGQLFNGKTWDVFYDEPVNFEKPASMSDKFSNTLWLKYIVNVWHKNYKEHRVHFGRYICRLWNSAHEEQEQVSTFKIYYMLEVSPPPGEPPPEPRREEIWSHTCF